MTAEGVQYWRLWEGAYKVEWKGIDLGRIHLRNSGQWQWMSMRAVLTGYADTLTEAVDALVSAELKDEG